ncbi:DinB family protein [Ekhidna sp. To15]|uniref:DinB family protein n=1 Tax=Ekhidna sp. To15 TaxID=3395267 RepID=UPI003F528C07
MKNAIKEKLKRLNTDTEKIYASLDEIPAEKLSDTSYGWSLIQVISHLNSAESGSLKYMQKKIQAGDKMENSGPSNTFRMWLCNSALRSSLKWKAPSYISNPPAYEYHEMKSKWAETREAIRQFVDEYPDQWLNKLVYKHPLGGRQNLDRAVDSFIYHQIHHMHQINRIRKQIGV